MSARLRFDTVFHLLPTLHISFFEAKCHMLHMCYKVYQQFVPSNAFSAIKWENKNGKLQKNIITMLLGCIYTKSDVAAETPVLPLIWIWVVRFGCSGGDHRLCRENKHFPNFWRNATAHCGGQSRNLLAIRKKHNGVHSHTAAQPCANCHNAWFSVNADLPNPNPYHDRGGNALWWHLVSIHITKNK